MIPNIQTLTNHLKSFPNKPIKFHLFVSLIIRLILLLWSIYQDKNFTVKFTDVDYHVFNDASVAILEGKSPYFRHTYRQII